MATQATVETKAAEGTATAGQVERARLLEAWRKAEVERALTAKPEEAAERAREARIAAAWNAAKEEQAKKAAEQRATKEGKAKPAAEPPGLVISMPVLSVAHDASLRCAECGDSKMAIFRDPSDRKTYCGACWHAFYGRAPSASYRALQYRTAAGASSSASSGRSSPSSSRPLPK